MLRPGTPEDTPEDKIVNDLFRELAPISEDGWEEIDAEAKRSLELYSAARKVCDFDGPHGLGTAAVSTGRLAALDVTPGDGVNARVRQAQTLVEFKTPFSLDREELDSVVRGSKDPDLDAVIAAAAQAAGAEDCAVFHGFDAGGIPGMAPSSPHERLAIPDDYGLFLGVVGDAIEILTEAGVGGPYAVSLGPRCYRGLVEARDERGIPIIHDVQRIVDGPIIWAPAVDGTIVSSLRGGDYEIVSGQDYAIGYDSHDATTVNLYVKETFTSRVYTPEAAVHLSYG